MNISKSFADYLVTLTGSTLGQDFFIGQAPSSNKVVDTIFWTVATGGSIVGDNVTNEAMKAYTIEIYYRSRNYGQVLEQLQDLDITLNCASCITLEDFVVVQSRATLLGIDDDLDNEDRKVGLIQNDIIVYEACIS